jgi:hypothetical protein
MPAHSPESLRTLRAQVASLQVIRCRMVHERVRIENGVALRRSGGGAEPALVRLGLCSPEVRGRNLACGHTMARYVLFDAVRALQQDPLLEALETVHNAIHLLDHQKGDAERQLALSSEMKNVLETARWASEIERIEQQHDLHVEQIRKIQAAMLAHLDAAIHEGEPVPTLA